MGSYGIGISRIPAAMIEYSHDEKGIIWPVDFAPFKVIIINLLTENDKTSLFSETLYLNLMKKKIDVLYDDRNERPGVKFSDSDLLGIPIKVIVGKKFINDSQVTIKHRADDYESNHNSDEILDYLTKKIK